MNDILHESNIDLVNSFVRFTAKEFRNLVLQVKLHQNRLFTRRFARGTLLSSRVSKTNLKGHFLRGITLLNLNFK